MNTLTLTAALVCSALCSMTIGEASVKTENVVVVPVKNDPTVCFRIWFKVGSQNDPGGKEGLASITAAMLTDGSTLRNSYEQILEKLYPLAAAYDATVSAEMTVIYGRVHKDNLGEYYPLFLDAMTAPAFSQQDLDRIKSQTLNYLENTLRYSSDEELGKAVLYNAIFAGTPYGHIDSGLVSSVKSITLDDVRSFYKIYFTRDNLVVGLGGGYDATLLSRLEKDLGKLPAGKPRPIDPPVPAGLRGFKATIVEKDAPATAISMGVPIDILRGSKDWYALAIANSWLGEHRNSSSHLYQVIREARGLNYGDYSYIENFPEAGRRTVPPDAGHFALRAALREYRHLVENGLTKEQFSLTRKFLKKYILNYATTTMARLGYAIDDSFYGIPGSHLAQFRAMAGTLTLADVNKAIKKHLHYGSMEIVVVAKDAKGFHDELAGDLPSPITYGTKKPEVVQNEDKEIAVFPVKLSPEDITVVPVTEIFR